MDVESNIVTMANLAAASRRQGVPARRRACARPSRDFVNLLNIRTPSATQEVRLLSGGNQQKIVIAKWLAARLRHPVLRRADARHRRRRQERDLQAAASALADAGQGDRHDLLGAAGDPAHERPHRRDVRGPHHRRARRPRRRRRKRIMQLATQREPDAGVTAEHPRHDDATEHRRCEPGRAVAARAASSRSTALQKLLAFASLIAADGLFQLRRRPLSCRWTISLGILQATAVNGVLGDRLHLRHHHRRHRPVGRHADDLHAR